MDIGAADRRLHDSRGILLRFTHEIGTKFPVPGNGASTEAKEDALQSRSGITGSECFANTAMRFCDSVIFVVSELLVS